MSERRSAPPREAVEKAVMHIVQNEPLFAVGVEEIRGVPHRVFKNAPPDLRGLIAICESHGDRTGVVLGDQRWSFAELARNARTFGAGLAAKLGVKKGDMVALAMRNSPEWMAAYLGIASIGAVVVPLNGWWTEEEMGFALGHCGAKFVICDPEQGVRILPSKTKLGFTLIAARGDLDGADDHYDAVFEAGRGVEPPAVDIAPDDDLAVMYTSGSTGLPKGVILTHRGAWSPLLSFALLVTATKATPEGASLFPEEPSILVTLPLFHVTGSHAVFMLSVLAGRTLVLMHKWSPSEAARLIEAEKITNFVGVPTMSHELMLAAREGGYSLDSLTDIGSGGAKRPAAQVAELTKQFPRAWASSGYGLTESSALGTYNGMADYQTHPGAAGRVIPPVTELRVVLDDGTDAPLGEVGEVWIRTPGNFRGYLGQPEETAKALTPDGWLRTGDLGTLDGEGFLTIVDRLKDMIVRGGENVACLEVEAALLRHPEIREAAVFSVPDERLGEAVGAAIVVAPGTELETGDILAFLKPHLAAFKRPDHIWIRTSKLPRTGTEKLDKRAIRKLCLEGDA